MTDADIGSVVDLLTRGFGRRRTRAYWQRGIDRLAAHHGPEGTPKFGYLMERDGVVVGVILMIHTMVPAGGELAPRCNLSSWYVEPAFRSHAALLVAQATKRRDITYLNMSPAPNTLPIVEAQGFTRYSNGQILAMALPSWSSASRRAIVAADGEPRGRCEPHERQVLADHARYGCICFWHDTAERAYPFVFVPRVLKGLVPSAQLIYCRDIADVTEFAKPIGAHLASCGKNVMLLDANGPMRGLIGKYFDGLAPKFYKGPVPPRLGDLAYTEAALFGL